MLFKSYSASVPLRRLLLLACVLCLAGRAGAACAAEYDHRGLARQELEAHIRPGYGRLHKAAGELAGTLDALCKTPSADGLAAARKGFGETVLAWSAVEHMRFGPILQEDRYERMAFWPDLKGIGRRQVARALRKHDESVLDPATLARKSITLQGLTALETLLYGKFGDRLAGGEEGADFRCRYALAIARNIETIAGKVSKAWSDEGAFAPLWLEPGPDNPVYRTGMEVTLEAVKAYSYGLELIRDAKIRGPLGMHSPGGKPSEPQYADASLSIPAVVAGIRGVKHLYDVGGLKARLEGPYPGMAKLIDVELDNALNLAGKLPADGPRAFEDEDSHAKLIAMGYPLKNAVVTGGGALGQAAGLSIGFNAGDGD